MRILTCAVFALATAPALAQDPNAGGLKTNVRSDQFTVSWLSSGAQAGTVEWSVNPAGPFTADPDDRGPAYIGTTHHCTVTGLAAGTTYSYRIVSGGVTYPTFTATTGPVLGPPVGSVLSFGQIFQSDGVTPAAQEIVYLTLSNADGVGSPGSAAPISILTDANGFWSTDLINALLGDLSGNFSFSTNGGDSLLVEAQGGALGVGSIGVPTQVNGGGNIAAPAIVLVADVAPAIGGLAQQTASGGALAWGGATTETGVILSATATDAGDSVKVQIEVKPNATPFDGVNFSQTALGASPLNAQIAFNGLAAGGYKWQARAVDDAGNASAWMSAPVALPHFTINAPADTTPPTGGLVNDGAGADVDSQASTTSISANWSGFADPESGIASYEWAIGTTAGGTNVQAYAPVAGTSATNAALALTNGVTYFVSVRAINGAGLTGAAVSSDGVTVQAGGPPPPPNSPPTLTNLNQSAPNGGTITVPTITLGATVNDVDANTVQLQVEVKPAASAFDGTGLLTSAAAAAGSALQINAGPFATGSYHWRARGIDSSGAQGAWVLYNGAGMDFAVQLNQIPSAPSGMLCENQTSPVGVLDSTPEFRAVYNDPDAGDLLAQIRIQVATDAGFATLLWDSGAVNTIPVPPGSLFISTAYALGAADLFWATTHYWRVKCFDSSGAESPWSATATFGMGTPSATLPNANGWQMVAVPSSTAVGLNAALADDLPAASLAAANEWDEPVRSYLGVATFAPMQALFVPSPALAVDLDTGTAAKGNKPFNADYTTLGGPAGIEAFANQYRGWNLAGNPFASTFDWEGVALASVTPSVYWWDGTQYVFYNAATNTPAGLNLIPSFRGFWIQALGSGASITIPDPTMFNWKYEAPTLDPPARPRYLDRVTDKPTRIDRRGVPSEDALVGAELGNYTIVGALGRGGMGVVYRARQEGLDRIVALKVLPEGGEQGDIDRFLREARASAKLSHPNIVSVHEVAAAGGRYFFTMDLVEGATLSAAVRAGALTPRASMEIAAKVARAIQYAHEQGIIHRDLKPSNVMLDGRGEPKVMDFGLAKDVTGSIGLTMSGAMLGTPSYMAPEQARGEKVDARADVYGLGAVLYECVTGRPPHVGATALEIIRKVIDEEPAAPRSLAPALSRDIETIVLKALAREPARRYATAGAVADDLQRFLDGDPIAARRSSLTYRVRRRIMRNPAAWTAAALGTAAVAIAAGLWLQARQEADLGGRALAIAREVDRVEAEGGALLAEAEVLGGTPSIDERRAIEIEAEFERVGNEAYRGWLLLMLGRRERGLAVLERAIQAAPDDPFPLLLRARWRLRRFATAVEIPLNTVVLMGGRRTVTIADPVETPAAIEALAAALRDLEAMAALPIWELLQPKREIRALGDGMRLFAERRFAEARLRLAEVSERSDLIVDARILLGTIELLEGNLRNAANHWEQAAAEAPGNAWAWVLSRAGVVQYTLAARRWTHEQVVPGEEIDRALVHLDRSIEIDPSDPGAHQARALTLMLRGLIQEDRGDDPVPAFTEALASFKRVVDLAPDHHYAIYNGARCRLNLAQIRWRRGEDPGPDIDAAGRIADTLVHHAPAWAPAYELRAEASRMQAMRMTGDAAERLLTRAIEDLDRAVEIEPGGLVQRYNRAAVCIALGEHHRRYDRWDRVVGPARRAEADLTVVIESDPQVSVAVLTRATARTLAATAEEELGEGDALETYRSALKDFELAIERLPSMFEAQINYANTLLRIGGHPKTPADEGLEYLTRAVGRYEFMLEKFTDRPDLAVNAGIAYMRRASRLERFGDHDAADRDDVAALRWFTRAIELNPRFLPGLRSRSHLCILAAGQNHAIGEYDVSRLLEMAREDVARWREVDPGSDGLAATEAKLRGLDEF